MKKIFIITACVFVVVGLLVLLLLLNGANSDLNVKIREPKAYQSEVEKKILYAKISNKAYAETFAESYGNDSETIEKNLAKVLLPTEYEDVLNELMRNDVIGAYLEKNNAVVEYDNCVEAAKSLYEMTKTDERQETFYKHLKSSLDFFGVEDEQYLELFIDFTYDFYNEQAAKNIFKNSKEYDEKSSLTPDEQFERFLDSYITQ